MNTKNKEDYPLTLEPIHIQEILNMGRRQAYQFLNNKPPFPVKRIGRDYKIFRDTFFDWYAS